MSIIYLLALGAVFAAVIGLMVEAVLSVSRKPVWDEIHPSHAMNSWIDRRSLELPYVGVERRGQTNLVGEAQAAETRKAA